MTEKLRLREEFPPVETAAWDEAIRRDLKGAEPAKLVWKTDEGIPVRPFYRAEELEKLAGLDAQPGQFPYLRGTRSNNHWTIRQAIDVADPQEANAAAREALAAGAEAICFLATPELPNQPEFAGSPGNGALRGVALQTAEQMRLLIAGISPEVAISFRAGRLARPLLLLYLAERKQGAEAGGTVDYDPLGDLLLSGRGAAGKAMMAEAADLLRVTAARAPRMRVLAVRGNEIAEAGGTAVEELAFAVARGVEYLSGLTDAGLTVDDAASRLFFTLSAGTNYFFEIAKLRALRMLWARAVESFAPKSADSAKAVVESVTARWPAAIYDAHNNLLRATTGAMSAAIGGADTIEVTPFDACYKPSDDFSRRLARNTQVLLKQEAYLDRVADPAGGSYYIETLTDSLAREAWRLFQQVEAEGGFLKALQSGMVQRTVAESRQRKDAAVAARTRVLLGSNQYPNTGEQALAKLVPKANLTPLRRSASKPAATAEALLEQFSANGLTLGDCLGAAISELKIEPLKPYRAAEPFEALRLRTERHAVKTGRRPRVLLLEYGDLKMRKARVGFSLNFFGVAGFEIVTASSEADPVAAAKVVADQTPDAVVLCSSDAEYPPLAGALIKAMDKPVPVIVAGLPKDALEQLKRDGVADFIHIRSNALDVLGGWQTKMGVE